MLLIEQTIDAAIANANNRNGLGSNRSDCSEAAASHANFYYLAQNGKLLKDARQLRSESRYRVESSAGSSAAAVPLRY
jgi:hypothetical protein